METTKGKEGSFGLSYPLLTKTNYTAWAMKMKVFMQAHGVWKAIDPKDPKAPTNDKMDKQALTIIYQGITEDLLQSIANKKTSKDTWDAIKTVHLGADKVKKAKVQMLKSEFEALTMRDSEQLDEFYNVCGRDRWIPKGSRGTNVWEKESSEQQLLLIEEEWMKKERKDGQLLLTREEWLKRTNKGGSGSNYEQRGGDFGRGYRDRSWVRCYNCGTYGHLQAECRKEQRDKEQRSEANLSQVECDEPTFLLVKCDDSKEVMILLNEEGTTPSLKATSKGNLVIFVVLSPPSTLSGNRYFLLLVDDFCRAMWVYMLKTKDEALVCFKRFKALVEKQSGEAIMVLRIDRGGEFCSMEFKTFCEDNGILRHYTAPYSP
ncbi:uncharacterized protein LOC141666207 [Apium graveolens]|uniref:uncharacterized protein LOC141666207 n=1 Tax=Apium graveolens TaxID=4045 RepID=UPI003D7A5522